MTNCETPTGSCASTSDLSRWTAEELAAVTASLDNRPRKTLGWKTPAEALTERLQSAEQASVATTTRIHQYVPTQIRQWRPLQFLRLHSGVGYKHPTQLFR